MEIKMAEIFGSEGMKNLHLRGALVLTGPEAEAAVLAVKNHDRLVEENNRLREALKATIKSSWGVINSDDEDFLEKVDLHKNLEGELSRAEELLSEIGGDL
ncbi:hypothetical protein [Vibrio paracholerae]|uniref:hypothetical protein n=1 Tax=Vibrio paracholerae TaxID=650003 RepID=UPI0020952B25|nr:hypothetical protein [Vibrio paracholerae]MCO7020855.1 hypothetical protein [Vibrio paracholerae]